jgi:hypothetical protein
MGLSGLQGPAYPLPPIAVVIAPTDSNNRSPTEPLPSPSPRLKIDTQVGESADKGQLNRRTKSLDDSGEYRPDVLSPTRYDSPVSNVRCDGWCKHDIFARRVAVSVALSFVLALVN